MTTPFAVKSSVVGGTQKFYTETPPYPFELWNSVCSNCPYDETMEGWEITQINGQDVPTFMKSWTRNGGTYYDDGVRANSFLAGSLWGQTSLTAFNMPASANFTVTLVNPTTNDPTTMTLPFAFGGSMSGWSRSGMISANTYSSSKRSHELFAERQLLDTLQERAVELHKRSADASAAADLAFVNSAISELTLNLERIRVDTHLSEALLRRDGAKALDRLPFIPSPRERMEDVMRLTQALWSQKTKPAREVVQSEVAKAIEQSNVKSVRKSSTASATEAPVIAGSSSKWTMYTTFSNPSSSPNYFETLTAYYGKYGSTSVVRLRSFSSTDGLWINAVSNAVTQRSSHNLNGNLIIDVTNNGGGSVCLNYGTMAYLVSAWTDLSKIVGDDIVYSLYDLRMSPILSQLYQGGDLDYTDAYSPTSGAWLGTTYYTNPTSRTIGNRTSSYTQVFNWNPCGTTNSFFAKARYHFDKIIVITDGRCGSSCAYFVTQLREHNKVRLVSYGGLYGEPLATSSFAGGNVYTWDYIRSVVSSATANPFSSYVAFNVRANYSPGKYPATPRQMERLEADWYLPIWDSLWRFYNAQNYNTTARFALYESVLPLFDQMPSGLPGAAPSMAISGAVIALATAMFAIML